ncbi:MAG: integrase arm-type DNA-binding domain-containing protein [Hyphomonadaceae bacterium]|nr:integrase arm-type DNA-binding domain-containing protein [Hyphomonadaceae bacterium]
MPNPKTQKKTLAEALAGPIRANGRKRRFYDTEVRGLALRVTPTGEKAFTLFDRVLGKPPSMTLADARQIARGAGANDVQPFRFLEACAGLGSAFAGVLIDEEVLRRFTITELERSMGFPDGWTAFGWNGKPATYAMRAALLGNAFCPPILHWIGEGIAANSVAIAA